MFDALTGEGEIVYFTDQVGEWAAVLTAIRDRDTHPYRRKKLDEIIAFLREGKLPKPSND